MKFSLLYVEGKEEEREGRKWEMRYFSRKPVDQKMDALCAKVGLKIEPELTGGFWQFDDDKYRHAVKRRDDPFSDEKAIVD